MHCLSATVHRSNSVCEVRHEYLLTLLHPIRQNQTAHQAHTRQEDGVKKQSLTNTKPRSGQRESPKGAKNATVGGASIHHDSLVVYVHGIGYHPPAEELKLQWDLAAFGRDMGERSRMAYWADLVHPVPSQRTSKSKRASVQSDSSLDLDEMPILTGNAKNDRLAREFSLALLQAFGVHEVSGSGALRKKVLPLPEWLRKPISRAFLKAFIADTAAYFFTAGLRERIHERLRLQLQVPVGQPVTIIAHSQGSVIAYEVLSAMKRDQISLDGLVTIGSPLGITEVQDFLEPRDLSVPKIVKRWCNFADPLDPVALDKRLAGDFTSMSMSIQDEVIQNSDSRRLSGFNPHSAVGYLVHPSVRRVIAESMRRDVMAPFILARDVAELLDAPPDSRHPVLIEVLEPAYAALEETEKELEAVEASEQVALSHTLKNETVSLKLEHRIESVAKLIRGIVSDKTAAKIDPLRRFVAAHLTAAELRQIGAAYKQMRVYAVWRSSRKSKLTGRSMRVLKADAALSSFGADGVGITWAVLDTGVQANHPHFDGVIDTVWDCTGTGRPVKILNARDADGHGTHVAGIIAGKAPAGKLDRRGRKLEQRGGAPRARLVVYKVLDDAGSGEDAWIIKALDHIAEQNDNVTAGLAIHGLNLSLGGPFDNSVYGCGFSPICAELRRLWRAGVLVVVACGNEGLLRVQTPDGEIEINSAMSIGDPANLDDCIAVGSVNADKPHLYGVSSFSSRGPTADGRAKPDVVAPGERISSCNARFRGEKDMYYEESGTSMAAPHVSGLLAAFLSVRREFRGRPDDVKRVLLASCNDLGRDRYHQGSGIPNLMQMLLAV